MKLLTYLQQTHGLSRRTITQAIKDGMVHINESKVEWFTVDLNEGDSITGWIGDKVVKAVITTDVAHAKSDIVLFHKPIGYVCSKADAHNKTIYELLPKDYRNYYYIGRLDKESRGLVMLTNNPAIVHKYEHPSQRILKIYEVIVRVMGDDEIDGEKLVDLMRVGRLCDPDGKYINERKGDKKVPWSDILSIVAGQEHDLPRTWVATGKKAHDRAFSITLNQGKKRHIRRLFHSLGYNVVDLLRIQIGDYKLEKLEEKEVKVVG